MQVEAPHPSPDQYPENEYTELKPGFHAREWYSDSAMASYFL